MEWMGAKGGSGIWEETNSAWREIIDGHALRCTENGEEEEECDGEDGLVMVAHFEDRL